MARGKSLLDVLNKTRAVARISLNAAHNLTARDTQVIMLQQEQERLWEDFDWPHLRVQRYITLQAGQYLYDPPEDLDFDRIEKVEVNYAGLWYRLGAGITPDDYFLYDPKLDQRSWPARRVQVAENDQIEIWPMPDTNGDPTTQEGVLRLTGIRKLNPFVEDSDTADLDDRLLSLFVGGAILAATGAKDAQLKIQMANKLYARLRGEQIKTTRFSMFSTTRYQPKQLREYVPRYIAPVS